MSYNKSDNNFGAQAQLQPLNEYASPGQIAGGVGDSELPTGEANNGGNVLSVITGDISGQLIEDKSLRVGLLQISGTLFVSDSDAGEASFRKASIVGDYGMLNMGINGKWSYFAANSSEAIQSLGEGRTLTDTFTVKSADGTTQTVTITITGVNDAAVITGDVSGSLTEDVDALNQVLMVTGTLVVTDVDSGEYFQVGDFDGEYGILQISETGEWVYAAENGQTAIQSLGEGDTLTDTFTVKSGDGTEQAVTITITGVNDAAVITGDVSGSLTEDAATTLTATGKLSVFDPDADEAVFQAGSVDSDLGTLTIDAAGNWTYTADNGHTAIQSLGEGDTLTDTFTVKSADGTEQAVTITITGMNDAAVITGDVSGSLTEDAASTLTATGKLSVSDPDADEAVFQAGSVDSDLGTLTIDAAGTWTYTAENGHTAIQSLGEGDTLTDTFTVKSADGTEQAVTITITGVNAPPVIDANAELSVDDTAAQSLTVSLQVTDADNEATELKYTITQAASRGVLLLNGVAITDFTHAVFTQDDIDKGLVTFKFVPTAGSTAQALTDDSFSFTVSDGDKTTDSQTFHIRNNVTQVWGTNDADDLTGLTNYADPGATSHVYGFDGNDTLRGGVNADTLDGGAGIDTADYSASAAAVNIDLRRPGAQSGGDAKGDILTGIERVVGTDHNDTIIGSNGADVLYGMDGNDYIWATYGNDTLYGGAGNDTVSGGRHANLLLGGDGDDTLYGQGNNDTLAGGAGADQLDGGAETDTADYSASTAWVNVDLSLATAQIGGGEGNHALGDTLTGIENLTGSNFNDVLSGDSGANVVNGLDGDDAVTAGASDTFDGGAGLDVLSSSDSALNLTTTHIQSVERIDLTGSAGSLTVNGDAILSNGAIDPLDSGRKALIVTGDAGDVVHFSGDTWAWHIAAESQTLGDGKSYAVYEATKDGETVRLYIHAGVVADSGLNEAPTIDYNATLHVNDTAAASLTGMLHALDTDNGAAELTYSIVSGPAHGVLMLNGVPITDFTHAVFTQDDIDKGLVTFKFVPTAGAAAQALTDDSFSFTVSDGEKTTDSQTFNIRNTVTQVWGTNDADDLTGLTNYADPGATSHVYGFDGNDTMRGGAGADTIDGGAGVDTADYSASTAWVNVGLNLATAQIGGDGNHALGDTLIGIENLTGSNLDDEFVGDSGANVLNGLGGNDSLMGGHGDDTLDGGEGNDTLDGGHGNNALYGGTGNDYLSISLTYINERGFLDGGDGDDTLIGGYSAATIYGGAGDDFVYSGQIDWHTGEVLYGGEGNDTLDGGAGNDILSGDDGNDSLDGGVNADNLAGGAGADTLRGGAGADTIDGGAGVDTADYSASEAAVNIDLRRTGAQSGGDAQGDILTRIESVIGSNHNDTIIGSDGADVLYGMDGNDDVRAAYGNDTLDGGAGNDTLWGATGANLVLGGDGDDKLYGQGNNDTLVGGAGADLLDGGTGVDTASYEGSESGVNVDLTRQGGGQTQSGGDAEGDVLIGIENLTGSNLGDVLTGDSGANVLDGLDGDDIITVGAGDTVDGGAGQDVLYSSDAALDVADSTIISGVERVDLTGGATSLTVNGDAILSNGAIDPLDSGRKALIVTGDVGDVVHFSGDTWAWHVAAESQLLSDGESYTVYEAANKDGETVRLYVHAGVGADSDVNDAPAFDLNATLHVNDTAATSLTGMLHASDTDNSAADLKYSIVGGSSHGELLLNGVPITDFTHAVFTQDDIDKGLVTFKFVPTAGSTAQALTDDSFSFTVSDGDKTTDSQTFNIRNTVTQVWGTNGGDDLTGLTNYDDPDATFHVYGFDGNDTMRGGAGADTIDGGAGVDTADYSASEAAVNIDLRRSGAQSGGDAKGDILIGIESVVGSDHNDTIIGSNGADVLYGMDGNDYIWATYGNDTLYGGAGNDTVSGGRHANFLLGGDGEDTLYGQLSDDILAGGAGADLLDGGTETDTADYSASTAWVNVDLGLTAAQMGGGDGNHALGDTLIGIENLTGSNFNDVLTGNGGANVLNGLEGDDAIKAGAGDTVNGGAGMDVLYSSDAALNLATTNIQGVERIDLTGSAGSLTVNGDTILSNGAIDPLDSGRKALIVTGDVGDVVHFSGDTWAWHNAAESQLLSDGESYTVYEAAKDSETVRLYVQADMTVESATVQGIGGGDEMQAAVSSGAMGESFVKIYGYGDGGILDEPSSVITSDVVADDPNSSPPRSVGNEVPFDELIFSEDSGLENPMPFTEGPGYDDGLLDLLKSMIADYGDSPASVHVDLNLQDGVTPQSGGDDGNTADGDILQNINILMGSDFGDTLICAEDGIVATIFGGSGNDTLYGGGRVYFLCGGDGDDVLHLNLNIKNVPGGTTILPEHIGGLDGGNGSDTLMLSCNDGGGVALDLSGLVRAGKITGIEHLDITGDADDANTLTLKVSDVLDTTGGADTLWVRGDANDSVTTTDLGWTHVGVETGADGQQYNHYSGYAGSTLVNLMIDANLATQNFEHS